MPKFRNIKVKMKGGKIRIQRAMVLASGRLKFVKNKSKSGKKRAGPATKSTKKRRNTQPKNTTKRRSNTVAKKKRFTRARGAFSKITGNKFVRGAVLGLGGGALALQVTERFAPQFSGIAAPIGAFVMGGPIGLVASVLLQGGLGFLSVGGNGNGTSISRTTV